jgi:hypothetical protein
MRTGKMACKEHLALLERNKQRARLKERTSEEVTDRSGEGESLLNLDGGEAGERGNEGHGPEGGEHIDGDYDGRSDEGAEIEDGAVLVGRD